MAITWVNVMAIAPETNVVNSDSRAAILLEVNRQISDTTWGARADEGRAYLAAHLATLGPIRGGQGAVSSESLGPASVSYAVPSGGSSASNAFYNLTSYGMQYRRLLRMTSAVLGMVP